MTPLELKADELWTLRLRLQRSSYTSSSNSIPHAFFIPDSREFVDVASVDVRAWRALFWYDLGIRDVGGLDSACCWSWIAVFHISVTWHKAARMLIKGSTGMSSAFSDENGGGEFERMKAKRHKEATDAPPPFR
jgi:hypothetical protein